MNIFVIFLIIIKVIKIILVIGMFVNAFFTVVNKPNILLNPSLRSYWYFLSIFRIHQISSTFDVEM